VGARVGTLAGELAGGLVHHHAAALRTVFGAVEPGNDDEGPDVHQGHVRLVVQMAIHFGHPAANGQRVQLGPTCGAVPRDTSLLFQLRACSRA
jgi:hypothetical protein